MIRIQFKTKIELLLNGDKKEEFDNPLLSSVDNPLLSVKENYFKGGSTNKQNKITLFSDKKYNDFTKENFKKEFLQNLNYVLSVR